jgi:hypothetical protein
MRIRLLALSLITALMLVACSKNPAPSGAEQNANQSNSAQEPAPSQSPNTAQVPPPEPMRAAPEPPPPPPKPLVVPAGTVITVRVEQALGSKASTTGDSFSATVAEPVSVDGKVAIPASSSAQGTVVDAKAKGKLKGEARLQKALTRITIKGHSYPIEAAMADLTQKGKGKRTAATTGGGAAGGALIGGIAGGGKGAAIGAGIGAAAGFLGGAFTGNKQIEIPAETALAFELKSPITLK